VVDFVAQCAGLLELQVLRMAIHLRFLAHGFCALSISACGTMLFSTLYACCLMRRRLVSQSASAIESV
jgi:hypothetical protein